MAVVRLRKGGIALAALLLGLGIAVGTMSSADARPASSSQVTAPPLGDDPNCVTKGLLTRTVAVEPDGTEVPAKDEDGLARRYYFSLNGDEIPETVPPPGFDALHASDEELQTYGMPPRPTGDPQMLAAWNAAAPTMHVGSLGVCTSNASAALLGTSSSSNWAGGMNINTVHTRVDMGWDQTAFDNVCPGSLGDSKYSTWTGLGGWSPSTKLAQAGTDVGSGLNSIYAFWEMINGAADTTEQIWPGSSVPPGHSADANVTYIPAGGPGTTAAFYFAVYDLSTSTYWSVGPLHMVLAQSARNFYDGTTAEFITEATSHSSGGLYYLRKPHLGTTLVTGALTDSVGIASFDSWKINEQNPTTLSVLQTSGFNGASAWSDTWNSCS